MLNNVTIYFVRHGETDWNLARRLQGTTDIPLNDTGRAQAARHGRVMAALDVDWSNFDFHASPLLRTKETMDIVRKEIGTAAPEPSYDKRLVEGAFGTWEGRTWIDISENDPADHKAFLQNGWEIAPHNGESYSDIARRLKEWAKTVTRDTVVVSHGGVSRVLRIVYLGLDTKKAMDLPTPQTSFFRFRGGEVDLI